MKVSLKDSRHFCSVCHVLWLASAWSSVCAPRPALVLTVVHFIVIEGHLLNFSALGADEAGGWRPVCAASHRSCEPVKFLSTNNVDVVVGGDGGLSYKRPQKLYISNDSYILCPCSHHVSNFLTFQQKAKIYLHIAAQRAMNNISNPRP